MRPRCFTSWFQRSKDGWHSLGSVPQGVGGSRTRDGGFAIRCLSHLATTPYLMRFSALTTSGTCEMPRRLSCKSRYRISFLGSSGIGKLLKPGWPFFLTRLAPDTHPSRCPTFTNPLKDKMGNFQTWNEPEFGFGPNLVTARITLTLILRKFGCRTLAATWPQLK